MAEQSLAVHSGKLGSTDSMTEKKKKKPSLEGDGVLARIMRGEKEKEK